MVKGLKVYDEPEMSSVPYEKMKKCISDGNLNGVSDESKNLLKAFPEFIDPLILPVVEILNAHGYETFESCQGGEGHCYSEPTVRFFGSEHDLIKAFDICLAYGLLALSAKRVWCKEDVYVNRGIGVNAIPIGSALGTPFNEITFLIHPETGTIFPAC